jgi:outer membrane protein TolC
MQLKLMTNIMDKLKLYFIILIIPMFHGNVNSQDSVSELDGYLKTAAMNNPGVKAAYQQYLAALEKVPQVGSLPDPVATFGFFIKPMEQLGGNQVGNIQLMQMFPWFGTLKAAKDEASMMAKAKYDAFTATKDELFFEVKSNWYQLMKYDLEIALVKNNIDLLQSLEKLTLIKFQSPDNSSSSVSPGTGSMNSANPGTAGNSPGSMTNMGNQQSPSNSGSSGMNRSPGMPGSMNSNQTGLQDVLRVRMEILEEQDRLALLLDQRRTEEVKFNALLNRDQNISVQISDSLLVQKLPVNKLAVADSIMSNNPMLSMLEDETGSYASMEQKARKMGLPMMGVGLNYMPVAKREGNTSMMNGKDMFMPMVSVTIPIYRKKYNAMQNEARLMQETGDQQTIDMKNNLNVRYRQFVQDLDDAERRMALYKEQEDLARKTADLLLTGFSTTGNNFEEVLRMQLKVLDYSFDHVEAIVDYNTAVAMAEKLMNSLKY